ncbi:MAG: ABC transporter permease [Oscillospiraceae bacterium]|jgi:peptide/nickel transport system permease protein|nr:ABC transporter permease [Oscillospiraceae bacterium]
MTGSLPAIRRGKVREVFLRLCSSPLTVFGMLVLLLLILVALFAGYIAPYPYDLQDYGSVLSFPSLSHPFGTDNLGRDILSRVIYGSRVSLLIGFISLFAGALCGSLSGALAGFFGGAADSFIMRFCDMVMSIPKIILAIAVSAILGPGLVNAMVSVSISSAPAFARVVRAGVITVKDREFIEASRAAGCGNGRILFRHILPNVAAPIIVQSTLGVSTAILLAASLSFLGLGVQPPTPEWGAMLSAARGFTRNEWYMVLFPGLAIMLSVLSLNLFGDGLRDALDPRLRDGRRF